jgi:hypothetical protein
MTVKVFRSTDYAAPTNTNAVGALIAILDACLVNGYGSQSVTITSSNGIATVTTPVAHLLKNDTFMRISGATQADYNGDFAITVTGSNTFTYQVANSPASPATGTITSKVAPADWTKPFSGTGLAAYKQGAGSNGFYLRVDNSFVAGYSSMPKIKAYTEMLDIDTGTNGTPESYAQMTYDAVSKPWFLIATEKAVYIICFNGSYWTPLFFGDFLSKKQGDAFNTLLIGSDNYYNSSNFFALTNTLAVSTNHYLMRNHTQLGNPIQCGLSSNLGSTNMGYGIPQPYPSPIDGALHLSPLIITEPSGIRGTIPGLWNPLHATPLVQGDIVVGTGDFVGKKFLVITGYGNYYQCLFEISNTW